MPKFVDKLVMCLALFGASILLATAAQAEDCVILIDRRLPMPAKNVFSGAQIGWYSRDVSPSVFENGHEFAAHDSREWMPDGDAYIFTWRDPNYYIVLKNPHAISGYEQAVAIRVDVPTANAPLTCSDLRAWRTELVRRELPLKGLADHLAGVPNEETVGESFIDAESSAYLNAKIEYRTDYFKAQYRHLLNQVKTRLSPLAEPTLTRKLDVVRDVLGNSGLKNYCADHASYKDFVELGCTNCQGQTFLFTALSLDLNLKDEKTLQVGIQHFADHDRPVLYDGTHTIDMVYNTKRPASHDPILPLKFLLYSSLQNQAQMVPKAFLKKFDDIWRPSNMSLVEWLTTKSQRLLGIKPTEVASNAHPKLAVKLFDFSNVGSKSNFGRGEPPKFATLTLDGTLESPGLEKPDGNGLFNDAGNDIVAWGPNCRDRPSYTFLLNESELKDREQIMSSAKGAITRAQYAKYGFNCPGQPFVDDRSKAGIYVPPELYRSLNLHQNWQQKTQAIKNFYIEKLATSLTLLTQALNRPFREFFVNTPEIEQLLTDLADCNIASENGFRDDYLNDTRVTDAYLKLIKSELIFQQRIIDHAQDFVRAINQTTKMQVGTHQFIWRDLFDLANQSLGSMGSSNGDRQQQLVMSELNLSEQQYRNLFNIFTWPIYNIISSDKVRVSVSHMKASVSPVHLNLIASPIVPVSKSTDAIQLPTFDLPISQAALVAYCKTSPSKYYYSGSFAWPCPKDELIQSEPKLPDEQIVSADVMKLFIDAVKNHMSLTLLTRFLAGIDSEFINIDAARVTNLNPQLPMRRISTRALYLLSSDAPTVNFDCAREIYLTHRTHQSDYSSCLPTQFNYSLANEHSKPPEWAHSANDWMYWKLAVTRIKTELSQVAKTEQLNYDPYGITLKWVETEWVWSQLEVNTAKNSRPDEIGMFDTIDNEFSDEKHHRVYILPIVDVEQLKKSRWRAQ